VTESIHKDIRVFRFTKDIVVRRGLEGRSSGPVPIFASTGKIIGFATILNEAGAVVADCAIDPSTPERLDLETNARSYWLDAALEYRGMVLGENGFVPTVVYVQALSLTETELDDTPIDGESGRMA
jgi:hypothetical protein